jgi:hypothetical protein
MLGYEHHWHEHQQPHQRIAAYLFKEQVHRGILDIFIVSVSASSAKALSKAGILVPKGEPRQHPDMSGLDNVTSFSTLLVLALRPDQYDAKHGKDHRRQNNGQYQDYPCAQHGPRPAAAELSAT